MNQQISKERMAVKPGSLDIRSALREGISRLAEAHVSSHTLAAELLLMHALGHDRAWIYSHPESAIDPADAEKYFALIARRAAGEPTQYIIGKQEFWGLEFEVNPSVLIPRPETEHVVEVALKRLLLGEGEADSGSAAAGGRIRVADVGTGSGCIAVALAKELPKAEILATDISVAALDVAQRNAARHGVAGQIEFIEADLLTSLLSPDAVTSTEVPIAGPEPPLAHESRITSHESCATNHDSRTTNRDSRPTPHHSPLTNDQSHLFNLIVSNPPYVSRDAVATLQREVRDYEPKGALFGGPAGTEIYARLIQQAAALLVSGGILVLELGYDSAPHVHSILEHSGRWRRIEITDDLAGIARVVAAEKA
jgi:release factor glutamine methyltransferase